MVLDRLMVSLPFPLNVCVAVFGSSACILDVYLLIFLKVVPEYHVSSALFEYCIDRTGSFSLDFSFCFFEVLFDGLCFALMRHVIKMVVFGFFSFL